jgi:hypothetical protein
MTKRNARPAWGMSDKQWDDFYARWREWIVVASLRGAVLAMNTKHEGPMRDLTERLLEDPWWKIRKLTLSPMIFKPEVPEDDMLFWQDGRLFTPNEFLGNKGFGRLNAKAPSRDGVTPWQAPDGYVPNLKADNE